MKKTLIGVLIILCLVTGLVAASIDWSFMRADAEVAEDWGGVESTEEDVTEEEITKEEITEEEITEEEVTEEEITEEEITEEDVTKEDVTKEDVTKEDVTEKDVTEEMFEEIAASNDIMLASTTDEAYATLYSDGTLIFSRGALTDSSHGSVVARYTDFENKDFEGKSFVPWNSNRNAVKTVTHINGTADIKITPVSTAYWFEDMTNLVSVNLRTFDTSKCTNMDSMFAGCSNLTTIKYISSLATQNVTNMYHMFSGCSSLTALNVSNFDTKNVTMMCSMFAYCENLTELDVSRFNTSKVTHMESMFHNCKSLTELDVSGFDTSKVTRMDNMFYDCRSLTELNVSGFDTSSVTEIDHMFYGCVYVAELDVSGFNLSKINGYNGLWGMFQKCKSVTKLDLSSANIPYETRMINLFSECNELVEVNIMGLNDTSNTSYISGMFYGCNELLKIDMLYDMNPAIFDQYAFKWCWMSLDNRLYDTFYDYQVDNKAGGTFYKARKILLYPNNSASGANYDFSYIYVPEYFNRFSSNKVPELPVYEAPQRFFLGWFTSLSSSATQLLKKDILPKDTNTLYAHWMAYSCNILVQNTENKYIKDVEVELYEKDNMSEGPLESWTTDGASYKLSVDLELNKTYVVVETSVPNEYEISDPVEFTTTSDRSQYYIVLRNELSLIDVSLDIQAPNGTPISGTGLTLWKLKDGSNTKDTSFEEHSWTSSSKEEVVSLPAGTYMMHETKAVTGYDAADDIRFTVSADGTVTVNGTKVDSVIMVNDYTQIDLSVLNTVKGNMGNKTKAFSFKMTLTPLKVGMLENDIPYVLMTDGVQTGSGTLHIGGGLLTSTSKDIINGIWNFELMHGQQITFTVPYGTQFVVQELDYAEDGYTVDDDYLEGMLTADESVSFTNTKNVGIPTGFDAMTEISGIMLTAGLVPFIIRRRKRMQE